MNGHLIHWKLVKKDKYLDYFHNRKLDMPKISKGIINVVRHCEKRNTGPGCSKAD